MDQHLKRMEDSENTAMTFYEAAVEVLRETGRPLHYKKITELAVSKNLLSHVGKTPEAIMETQLTEEVGKGKDATIVRVRAGVFALAADADPKQLAQPKLPSITLGEPPESTPEGAPVDSKEEQAKAKARRRRRRTREPAKENGRDEVEAKTSSKEAKKTPEPKEKPVDGKKSRTSGRTGESSNVAPSAQTAADLLKRSRGPVSAAKIADKLGRDFTAALVDELLTLDGRRCTQEGKRPRFTHGPSGWVLGDASLKREQVALYDALEEAHQAVISETRSTLAVQLAKLAPAVIEEICQAVLTKLGVSLELIDRERTSALYRALPSSGLGVGPVAVKVYVDKAHADADGIAALRGRLANYGCVRAVVVSPRSGFSDAARTEAGYEAGPAIDLLDARDLASLAMEAGVGVRRYQLDVPTVDLSWFGARTRHR